jgi:hypothetical protein
VHSGGLSLFLLRFGQDSTSLQLPAQRAVLSALTPSAAYILLCAEQCQVVTAVVSRDFLGDISNLSRSRVAAMLAGRFAGLGTWGGLDLSVAEDRSPRRWRCDRTWLYVHAAVLFDGC